MTTAGGLDLGLLLGRLLADHGALVQRVLQPVMEQLYRDGAFADNGDTPPDLLIATAIGNRLAGLVAAGDPPAPADGPAPSLGDGDLAHYELLIERNSVLAAALGACDCWGQQPNCPICDGAGAPGWVLPERRLFTRYVYPAVRTVKKFSVPPIAPGRRAPNDQEENGYVEHVAR